ncbi:MAG TPA: GntR family transcriptional regulator [Acidimicrobiales bacterium]|jgi:DNA-binding GntR family transcriptional regulator|nr:GntR family transcriptional regulator [Acidimicrobiales bacterium]
MAIAASVTDQLRDDILEGAFPPGERLIELQLAERYGVGRAAIRAALVELDAEGLVRREANRGATVRRISVTEAVEITQARAALEGLIAGLAAERATDGERDELCALLAEMTDAVEHEDKLAYSKLNRALHGTLCRIARHRVADDLVANLRNRAAHHQFRLALVPGRAAESLAQHRAIVEAVTAGDGPAAEAAMRDHLASVIDVLRHWEAFDTRA